MLIYVVFKCWVNLNNCSYWFLYYFYENFFILVYFIFGVVRLLFSLVELSWILLWLICYLVVFFVLDFEYVGVCRCFLWVLCRFYFYVFVLFGDVFCFYFLLVLCLGCIKMFIYLE